MSKVVRDGNRINPEKEQFFAFVHKMFERERQLGLTKAALARRLEVSAQYVGRLVSGEMQETVPSFEMCKRLATVLKLSELERYHLLSSQVLARAPEIREVAQLKATLLSHTPPDQVLDQEWPCVDLL